MSTKKRIEDLHELFKNGIDRELFFKLIINITNGGYTETPTTWANYLKIESWMELYSDKNLKINVNIKQLLLFFNYLKKYLDTYIGKNGDFYYVSKLFTNDKRTENYLEFESVVFQAFEVVTCPTDNDDQ